MAIKGKQDVIAAGRMTEQFKAHKSVLNDFTFNKNAQRTFGAGKISRTIYIRDSGGIKIPEGMEEFIVFHQLNPQKNTFLFNPQIIAAFNNYCMVTTGKTYKASTVQQLLRKGLVERNIIVNVSKGKYMLNPMIGGCTTFAVRRTLIAEYNDLLIRKRKNTFTGFYPKYSK
ncbi:MAG: hypothetical protein NTX08_09655 [Sphingobacteriales bacterium]|nr:hypothetical protein [Sphingobacteriales bacterium]